jgi:hypothetical protein
MQSLLPLEKSDLDLEDSSFVRSAFTSLWQDLPTLALGAVLPAAAGALSMVLLLLDLPTPAALVALVCGSPTWTAYCRLVCRLATGHSVRLRDLLPTCRDVYWRSITLAAPLLLIAWGFAALPAGDRFAVASTEEGVALLLIAANTVTLIALVVSVCAAMQGLAIVAAFDLPLRTAANNLAIVLLAKPWIVFGMASLAYLLATTAVPMGPAAWLLALIIYTVFQAHATILMSAQLIRVQGNQVPIARTKREDTAK